MRWASGVSVRSAVAVVMVLAIAVGGVGGGQNGAFSPARTWAAPLEQAAPGPLVQQAFDLLMDRFVTPPSSGTLLAGGWEGGVRFVQERANAAPEGAAPAFSGDRAADWKAFLAAYPVLVTALGGAAEQVDLDRALVSGMAESLKSNDTYYIPPSPPDGRNYVGIGVTISRALVVERVVQGSPAEAAGLFPFDRIVAVDGTSVEGLSPVAVSGKIRGPAGSVVEISVVRGQSSVPTAFQITRATIQAPWVDSRLLDDGIGYVRIALWPSLEEIAEFDRALNLLQEKQVSAVIVDLRSTRGGPFATFEQVAGRLMLPRALYQSTNRAGEQRTVPTNGPHWGKSVPMAVLVNEFTRSQSELLTQALRDTGLATVLGTRTAGAVTAGTPLPLTDGSTLVVTTHEVVSGQGVVLNGVGVEPDLVVELDPAMLAQGKDSQLEAALAHLRGKLGR